MPKKRQLDWYIWGEWVGLTWFHSCYNEGLAFDLKKRSGFGLDYFAVDLKNKTQRLFLSKSEWLDNGAKYLQKILKSPHILQRDLRTVAKAAQALFVFNNKLAKLDVNSLSYEQVTDLYDQSHKLHHELWSAGMVPNLLEFEQSQLSDYLHQRAKISSSRKLSEEMWQQLVVPLKLSWAQQEERDFLALTLEIERQRRLVLSKSLKRAAKELQKFPKLWQKLQKHYQKYRWVQYGWNGPATEFNYYLDRLARLVRQGNARQLLNKLKSDHRKSVLTQKAVLRQVRFSSKERSLLKMLQEILYLKTARVDAFYQGYFAMKPLLERISRELLLTFEQLRMMHGSEITSALLSRSANKKLLQEMLRYSAYIKEGNNLKLYTGPAARKKISPILKALPKQKAVSEITGQIAYVGKVRGRARLVNSSAEMGKVKKGDIIVSYSTDPSLLPAMQKAAAFVTDMGGLTAHAAIVAREMKKPCIVGTKIASRIFKDGQLIEVDAEQGVVRKI